MKKLLRLLLFILVALVTLAALAGSWLSFSSRREWARTKADLLARGEKLSLVELTPPPVPDERNFFGAPPWKELSSQADGERLLDVLDAEVPAQVLERVTPLVDPNQLTSPRRSTVVLRLWGALRQSTDDSQREEIARTLLAVLAPAQPTLDELRAALDRPEARFPTGKAGEFDPVLLTSITNFLLKIAQAWGAEASAALALGNSAEAAARVTEIIALSQTLNSEPSLLPALIETSVAKLAAGAIAEGLPLWSADDLTRFELALGQIDLRRRLALALRGERGRSNQFFESLRNPETEASATWKETADRWMTRFGPSEQAAINRRLQIYVDLCEAPEGFDPEAFDAITATHNHPAWLIRNVVLKQLDEALAQAIPQNLFAENQIVLTEVACALRRYDLKFHHYPEALSELIPEFLSALPATVIRGDALHYRREGSDAFRLWSGGWNRTNEHAEASRKSRGDFRTADWVWNEFPGPLRNH